MRLEAVELIRIGIPLVAPFETSFGVQSDRDILLVKAVTSDGEGWGECVAGEEPTYSPEYVDGAQHVLAHHLLPRLVEREELKAEDVFGLLGHVHGHQMAKAAIEMAILDAQLRASGESFGKYFGAVRAEVDCGVSVGIHPSIPELLRTVGGFLDQGYRRIKLKIKPGWDLEPVRAVRERFGDVPLQVDANTAYRLSDAKHLAELAADAIELHACRIINIKPGRVGGYLEARHIHDLCASHSIPVWMGGMLETGIGRAGNVAMAAMSNFALPGDTSASDRYYHRDIITEPFVLHDGRLRVPTRPGLGVTVDEERLREVTTSTMELRREMQWTSPTTASR